MSTVAIPIKVYPTADGHGQNLYVEHNGSWVAHITEYGSEAKGRKALRDVVLDRLYDAEMSERNNRIRAIGCADGTVLIVTFHAGSWGYRIFGPGRDGRCSVMGIAGMEEAMERARDHAGQSFGGVSWES